jgi:uncharacterized protein
MEKKIIICKKNNLVISDNVKYADTFFLKLKGLLVRNSIDKNECLIILDAKQIHSFFMKFSIDIIFLDKNKRVIALYNDFSPYKLTKIFFNSKYVLELHKGAIKEKNIQINDELVFETR